jgi:serine/threonine protein kinase
MISTTEEQKISKSFSSKLTELGYTYAQQIGSDSFGTIHLVFFQSYQQYFVIKEKKSKLDLISESEFLKQLVHPNIISIYSYFAIDQSDFLVLEYCSRGSLQELIDTCGPICPPKLYSYCSQLLSAVSIFMKTKLLILISNQQMSC